MTRVKTLILMRHGKAVPGYDGQPDIERELSEAGKRALKASLPAMLVQLPSNAGDIAILRSPAVRTVQTAELLASALKDRGTKVKSDSIDCDALWTQDAQAFSEVFASCDVDIVFAVGHCPFVDDYCRQLTGAVLPFATGALAAISVNLDDPGNITSNEDATRLLWFSQGPISQRWKTLVSIEDTLSRAARTVKERLRAFSEDPEDIETLHKLRVSIRTLRSLVAFIKPWQDARQNVRAQQLLKDVVACTSRQRELDVFTEQARESTAGSPEIVAFCQEQASAERERVQKALASKSLAKKLDEALDIVRSVKWKGNVRKCGLGSAEVRAHFDNMVSSLEGEMQDLQLSDVELTHDVRKRAKRVRYAAENFKQIVGEDAVDIAKGMTAHQDNLGAICDARVNIDLINDFMSQELPDPIAWDFSLLRAQNETFLYTILRASMSPR